MEVRLKRMLMIFAIVFGVNAHWANALAGVQAIDVNSYPVMDDKELGHLRYSIKIAQQPTSDFSLIPMTDLYGVPFTGRLQMTMSSARYTLAFMSYFLALEQFHKLPAYTELIHPYFDRIIQKMVHKKTWEYWATDSKGMPPYEPWLNRPYPPQHDPVAHKNVMYSGHLAQIISLYEKLYGDMKWSRPRSIEFAWSPSEKYVYDAGTLHKLLYDQFEDSLSHCIECQPNACFPVCNQHPLLALIVYDQVHGTNYSPQVTKTLLDWYLKNDLIDPVSHTIAAMYLVKQQRIVGKHEPGFGNVLDIMIKPLSMMGILGMYSAAVDGWNGLFMNVWDHELIAEHYPYQIKNSVVIKDDTYAYTRKIGVYDQLSAPFFAAMAAEMGDTGLRDKLLNWSERQYKAGFDSEGNYFYPPGVEVPVTLWPGYSYKGLPLTDKVAAIARANMKDGMRKLHLSPFKGNEPAALKITGVDFPALLVSRAIYDDARDALIVTVQPSLVNREAMSRFNIVHLDPRKSYDLWIDDALMGSYGGESEITVKVPLDRKYDIVLVARE